MTGVWVICVLSDEFSYMLVGVELSTVMTVWGGNEKAMALETKGAITRGSGCRYSERRI